MAHMPPFQIEGLPEGMDCLGVELRYVEGVMAGKIRWRPSKPLSEENTIQTVLGVGVCRLRVNKGRDLFELDNVIWDYSPTVEKPAGVFETAFACLGANPDPKLRLRAVRYIDAGIARDLLVKDYEIGLRHSTEAPDFV